MIGYLRSPAEALEDEAAGEVIMDEHGIRELVEEVRRGRLSRRIFVRTSRTGTGRRDRATA